VALAKTIQFTCNIAGGINNGKLTPIFNHSEIISRGINHSEIISQCNDKL